jgi:hypothetical protein
VRLNVVSQSTRFLLTTASWVWLPVPMLLKPPFEYYGPVSHDWPTKAQFPWMTYLALSWSFVVGACFGFIVPRLFRGDVEPPNRR